MSKSKSLADKISGLLNTAPSYNPDEQNEAEPEKAKVVDYEENEDNQNSDEEQALSAYRKQNLSLLEDVDERYAGRKGSRKDLQYSDDDLQPGYIDQESDSSVDEVDEDDNTEDDDDDEEKETIAKDEEDTFKHLNDTNVKAINKKSLSVQNQIRMWENFLEMRIQLQKCLVQSNKLPQTSVFKQMKQNDEFAEKSESLKKTLSSTLSNMLELQQLTIKKFPESKNIFKKQQNKNKEEIEDDEEIPSDTENEDDEEENDESDEDEKPPPLKKKKISQNELETQVTQMHKTYKAFRNETIQKWNDKTQIAQGKKQNVNSVLNQIEHNLSDKAKLVKRTQLKRSEYTILGSKLEITDNEETGDKTTEYNKNIFDDDDFYHQLLRELIEVKSADITDPIQLSRQWIQLQNLRSKMKRKIDTRATKGRKIRYGVHTKLVNFMAPLLSETVTDEAQTELFMSLFGKKH